MNTQQQIKVLERVVADLAALSKANAHFGVATREIPKLRPMHAELEKALETAYKRQGERGGLKSFAASLDQDAKQGYTRD